ncbi:MAG TPA: hypothetical protein VN025_11505 [Candidatus Dormibacteraeota bacterium]|jgi:hypothetical protein|nr:hypothetical protein [Candidatus Dormibacteraeota bacterium]
MSFHRENLVQFTVKKYAFYFAALGVLFVFTFWATWKSSVHNDVPKNLLGIWVTSESAHRDRFLEISPVTVTFGTGGATESTGLIQECEEVPDGVRVLYNITYKVDDGEAKLTFSYDRSTKELRLKNQQAIIWHKLESD